MLGQAIDGKRLRDLLIEAIRYVRRPFTIQPDFNAVSVNYDLGELWKQGSAPG